MCSTSKLSAVDGPSFEDSLLYRSIVGSLQYLSFTRSDLSFAINKVSQFMHYLCVSHWQVIKRILHYLCLTTNFGFYFSSTTTHKLISFLDADWANCLDDHKSTGGFCVYFDSYLISWGFKKQPTIAWFSIKAEYKAIANATYEIIWVQSLLNELGIFLVESPTLWCDNLTATYLSVNPVLHACTKNVELDFHFVWDRVVAKTLKVSFVPSKDQVVDILTKPLPIV